MKRGRNHDYIDYKSFPYRENFACTAIYKKYQYPYLSIVHLKMGLIRSGNINMTPDDKGLEVYLWPIVREIIKTAIENQQNLVVEGCYIPFYWKEDFSGEHLDEIRYYCLRMSRNYIEQHFSDIKEHADEIESAWMTQGLR